jgi:DNA repair exonuclease SbcCD ATPase subunit
MDSAELARARQLRSEILAGQAAALRKLQKELEEADFFDTRGGFERVADSVDELVARYGEANFEDLSAATSLRAQARERLAAFDQATTTAKRERLAMLADAFGEAGQPDLQKIVQDYIARHLPEAGEAGETNAAGETNEAGGGRD